MAPTICSEKESQVRRIRRRSSSSSVISYVGKITHRRSVSMRNASSKLATLRLSSKLSYCESDTNEESVQSEADLKGAERREEKEMLENSISSPSFSETSTNCDCSDRLTPGLTTDSGYTTPSSHEQHFCENDNISASREVLLVLNEEDSFSHTSSSMDCNDQFEKASISRKRKNSKGLLEIAIKTIKLIKRNRLLQQKLAQLQFETRAFIESVMANPENRALRDKMEKSTHSE